MQLRSKILLPFFFIATSSLGLFAQKTDKVFLNNGNMILCEIVELAVGKLDCKTNDIGRIKVEWDAIDSLWSEKEFEVHLSNGTIVYTAFDSTFYNYTDYQFEDMIDFNQIKKKFWKRIDGNADLGFNYAKSSGILQLNIDSKVKYHYYRGELDLNFNTIFTVDQGENRTDKKDSKLIIKQFLSHKNFLTGSTGFDQNTELGIQARLSIGGGFGKNIIYNPKTRLNGSLGVILNEERSTEANTSGTTNIEIVGSVDFNKFSYNHPELDIYAGVKLFASINDFGRLRGELNTNARIEVISDFYIKFTIYYSFDSKPADQEASQNDWGTTLTLSYSF
jgi:Protein of unknown function, DUF481